MLLPDMAAALEVHWHPVLNLQQMGCCQSVGAEVEMLFGYTKVEPKESQIQGESLILSIMQPKGFRDQCNRV